MNKVAVGIDVGTAAVKVAFATGTELLWHAKVPASCRNTDACAELFAAGLAALGLDESQVVAVAATGYGRERCGRPAKLVNEVAANALGAHVLSGGQARAVVNIGGQDVKVIKLTPVGKVLDFRMNDKCAARTGRFFEMAERILDTPLRDFGALGSASLEPLELNSTCAVFAETEIVSLVSEGRRREDIIAGLNRSIAARVAALCDNMGLEDGLYLDGGPATNQGLRSCLGEALGREVEVLPHPQFTVAFGAAALALRPSAVKSQ